MNQMLRILSLLALLVVASCNSPSFAQNAAYGSTPTTVLAAPALALRTGPGALQGFGITMGSTAGFLAILNVSAVPAASAVINPVECIPVAVNSNVRVRQDYPDRYTIGIVLLSTSSCTTYTAVVPVLLQGVTGSY